MSDIIGRVAGIIAFDPVRVVGRGLGRIEACLGLLAQSPTRSRVSAHLDQVLALGLGDERLELGSSEGVDQSGLGNDEKKHLGAGKDRKLICLKLQVSMRHVLSWVWVGCDVVVPTRSRRAVAARTFFMMPAFLLEKVMCRRDLS